MWEGSGFPGGLREGQEGELGPQEGASEPGWVSPGDFGFVGPFPGRRETVLILVYVRVSGEATSLRLNPAISSQFCNLSKPGAMETILTGSRAASPTHRERGPPCANLGFNLSAQHSHRLGSLRRGLPPPASRTPCRHTAHLQQMLAWGYCNSIIELTLIWPILPFATSYGTQSPHCKQKGVPLSS